jgi:hypothetical protein
MSQPSEHASGTVGPPDFLHATTRRQKARAAGLDPNYWYPVEQVRNLRPGRVREVFFWKRSIALYRGQDGSFHAVDNRCAHRQLRLSEGTVEGCRIVCPYHGWAYDGDGRLCDVPHELFGRKKLPRLSIGRLPVKVRYGLVFIFPGDPALAERVRIPELPWAEGDDRWAVAPPLDYTWRAHHSMILDNVSDYTHAWLHRRTEPFKNPTLERHQTIGDAVHLWYRADIGGGRWLDGFVPREDLSSPVMHLCYEYPYHWSNSGDLIRHFMFVLPIDQRTSRIFFILFYRKLRVPFTRLIFPRPLLEQFLKLGNRTLMHLIFSEDGRALEEEQRAWERNYDAPAVELNPIVPAFQDLTIRKWEAYLARGRQAAHG